MASEIRANKQTNRVGLGTVTYTDTGIIVSGIVTANSFKGDGSSLTGITTVGDTRGVDFNDNVKIRLGTDNDLELYHDGNHNIIKGNTGFTKILTGSVFSVKNLGDSKSSVEAIPSTHVKLFYNGNEKIATTNTGAVVTGILTATSFSGDGSSLSNLPSGAPVGGASTNTVFFENDKAVEVNYQITSNKNAMSAGPISIAAGIAVTVPSGSVWTIV